MIEVDRVVKRFAGAEVLRGVSLALAPGEVAAIIGPSGSGKSTLLRCLNGLEGLDGGEVRIGTDVLTASTHPRRDAEVLRRVRQRLGFVFQTFNLFPHLSVLDNCCLGPVRVLGEPRPAVEARVMELLARVGVADKARSYPRTLSGGQQQRAAIVRALAMRPEAMLFDEPTSALDPAMAAEVMAVVTDLAKSGQAMIVVTHSMTFARSVAHRVHVFAGGAAVESGPPAEVFEQPRHPVTRTLLDPQK